MVKEQCIPQQQNELLNLKMKCTITPLIWLETTHTMHLEQRPQQAENRTWGFGIA
jgi:hypothetical protein